jgi:hypothetical protein
MTIKDKTMLHEATEKDFDAIYTIINDAAIDYKGIIPADRWHEPYMPKEELEAQIEDSVQQAKHKRIFASNDTVLVRSAHPTKAISMCRVLRTRIVAFSVLLAVVSKLTQK